MQKEPEIETENINRDILECKLGWHLRIMAGILILIETYWNVNIHQDQVVKALKTNINRDILECK